MSPLAIDANSKIDAEDFSRMIRFPERFNMADYFLYHNLEEGRENKVCLYFEDKKFTYFETAGMSNRVGNALRELGTEIEDRVLIVLPDCPEFVWTWFGAARIGAVITMVNPLLPAEDYKYYLEYTRARVAVIPQSIAESFREAAFVSEYLRAVLVVEHGNGASPPHQDIHIERNHNSGHRRREPEWVSFDAIVGAQAEECLPADTHRDDMAIWLFTSGSTGHPKGAVHLNEPRANSLPRSR